MKKERVHFSESKEWKTAVTRVTNMLLSVLQDPLAPDIDEIADHFFDDVEEQILKS
jgi:hypothetical protein